jgi:hypothetical protein
MEFTDLPRKWSTNIHNKGLFTGRQTIGLVASAINSLEMIHIKQKAEIKFQLPLDGATNPLGLYS